MANVIPTIAIIAEREVDRDHHYMNLQEALTDIEDLDVDTESCTPKQNNKKFKNKLLIKLTNINGAITDVEYMEASDEEDVDSTVQKYAVLINFNSDDTPIIFNEKSYAIPCRSVTGRRKLYSQSSTTKQPMQKKYQDTILDNHTDMEDYPINEDDYLEDDPKIYNILLKDDFFESTDDVNHKSRIISSDISSNSDNESNISNVVPSKSNTLMPIFGPETLLTDIETLSSSESNAKTKKCRRNKRRRPKGNLRNRGGVTDIEDFNVSDNEAYRYCTAPSINAEAGLRMKMSKTSTFKSTDSEEFEDDKKKISSKMATNHLHVQVDETSGLTDIEIINFGEALSDVEFKYDEKKLCKIFDYMFDCYGNVSDVSKDPKDHTFNKITDSPDNSLSFYKQPTDKLPQKVDLKYPNPKVSTIRYGSIRSRNINKLKCGTYSSPDNNERHYRGGTDVENLYSSEEEPESKTIPIAYVKAHESDTEIDVVSCDERATADFHEFDCELPKSFRKLIRIKENISTKPTVMVMPLSNTYNAGLIAMNDLSDTESENYSDDNELIVSGDIKRAPTPDVFTAEDDIIESRDFTILEEKQKPRIAEDLTDTEEVKYKKPNSRSGRIIIVKQLLPKALEISDKTDCDEIDRPDIEVNKNTSSLFVPNINIKGNKSHTDIEDFEYSNCDSPPDKKTEICYTPQHMTKICGDFIIAKEEYSKFTDKINLGVNQKIIRTKKMRSNPVLTDMDDLDSSDDDDEIDIEIPIKVLNVKHNHERDARSKSNVNTHSTRKLNPDDPEDVMYLKVGGGTTEVSTDSKNIYGSNACEDVYERTEARYKNWFFGNTELKPKLIECTEVPEPIIEQAYSKPDKADNNEDPKMGEPEDISYESALLTEANRIYPIYSSSPNNISYSQIDLMLDKMLLEVEQHELLYKTELDLSEAITPPKCLSEVKLVPSPSALIEIPVEGQQLLSRSFESISEIEITDDNLDECFSLVCFNNAVQRKYEENIYDTLSLDSDSTTDPPPALVFADADSNPLGLSIQHSTKLDDINLKWDNSSNEEDCDYEPIEAHFITLMPSELLERAEYWDGMNRNLSIVPEEDEDFTSYTESYSSTNSNFQNQKETNKSFLTTKRPLSLNVAGMCEDSNDYTTSLLIDFNKTKCEPESKQTQAVLHRLLIRTPKANDKSNISNDYCKVESYMHPINLSTPPSSSSSSISPTTGSYTFQKGFETNPFRDWLSVKQDCEEAIEAKVEEGIIDGKMVINIDKRPKKGFFKNIKSYLSKSFDTDGLKKRKLFGRQKSVQITTAPPTVSKTDHPLTEIIIENQKEENSSNDVSLAIHQQASDIIDDVIRNSEIYVNKSAIENDGASHNSTIYKQKSRNKSVSFTGSDDQIAFINDCINDIQDELLKEEYLPPVRKRSIVEELLDDESEPLISTPNYLLQEEHNVFFKPHIEIMEYSSSEGSKDGSYMNLYNPSNEGYCQLKNLNEFEKDATPELIYEIVEDNNILDISPNINSQTFILGESESNNFHNECIYDSIVTETDYKVIPPIAVINNLDVTSYEIEEKHISPNTSMENNIENTDSPTKSPYKVEAVENIYSEKPTEYVDSSITMNEGSKDICESLQELNPNNPIFDVIINSLKPQECDRYATVIDDDHENHSDKLYMNDTVDDYNFSDKEPKQSIYNPEDSVQYLIDQTSINAFNAEVRNDEDLYHLENPDNDDVFLEFEHDNIIDGLSIDDSKMARHFSKYANDNQFVETDISTLFINSDSTSSKINPFSQQGLSNTSKQELIIKQLDSKEHIEENVNILLGNDTKPIETVREKIIEVIEVTDQGEIDNGLQGKRMGENERFNMHLDLSTDHTILIGPEEDAYGQLSDQLQSQEIASGIRKECADIQSPTVVQHDYTERGENTAGRDIEDNVPKITGEVINEINNNTNKIVLDGITISNITSYGITDNSCNPIFDNDDTFQEPLFDINKSYKEVPIENVQDENIITYPRLENNVFSSNSTSATTASSDLILDTKAIANDTQDKSTKSTNAKIGRTIGSNIHNLISESIDINQQPLVPCGSSPDLIQSKIVDPIFTSKHIYPKVMEQRTIDHFEKFPIDTFSFDKPSSDSEMNVKDFPKIADVGNNESNQQTIPRIIGVIHKSLDLSENEVIESDSIENLVNECDAIFDVFKNITSEDKNVSTSHIESISKITPVNDEVFSSQPVETTLPQNKIIDLDQTIPGTYSTLENNEKIDPMKSTNLTLANIERHYEVANKQFADLTYFPSEPVLQEDIKNDEISNAEYKIIYDQKDMLETQPLITDAENEDLPPLLIDSNPFQGKVIRKEVPSVVLQMGTPDQDENIYLIDNPIKSFANDISESTANKEEDKTRSGQILIVDDSIENSIPTISYDDFSVPNVLLRGHALIWKEDDDISGTNNNITQTDSYVPDSPIQLSKQDKKNSSKENYSITPVKGHDYPEEEYNFFSGYDALLQDYTISIADSIKENLISPANNFAKESCYKPITLASESPSLTPTPKPRTTKSETSFDNTISAQPVDIETNIQSEIATATLVSASSIESSESETYYDKRKFWESQEQHDQIIGVKKRFSLHEGPSEDIIKIVDKRKSIHEVSLEAPTPKPRSSASISRAESRGSDRGKSYFMEEEPTPAVTEYQASFKDPTVTTTTVQELSTQNVLEKENSTDSDVECSGNFNVSSAYDNTGYISDSGDVEHYISDSEIEDRVPQIRERQMSVFQPNVTGRKNICARSASLPTEDMYEVSADSIKLRKQYYEEQIKKEMVEDQLMTEIEEEDISQEHKTLEVKREQYEPSGVKSVPETRHDSDYNLLTKSKDEIENKLEEMYKKEMKDEALFLDSDRLETGSDITGETESSIQEKIMESERIIIDESLKESSFDLVLNIKSEISRPSDSLEVHVDKSEIEDSEKMVELDQDATDIDTKSLDSTELSPKTLYNSDITPANYVDTKAVSPIRQPVENIQTTVWEAPIQTQGTFEEKAIDIVVEKAPGHERDDELSVGTREESDLGSEIHQDHSDSYSSDRIKSESHDIEKLILESLHHQKISPEEAQIIATELIADIELEIHRRHSTPTEVVEPPAPEYAKNQISEYLQHLAEAKGLDSREIELVQSVLARKHRELAKLSRDDTQASSMEITDEELRYSGVDYSPSGSRVNILEEQIDQLKAERVSDIDIRSFEIKSEQSANSTETTKSTIMEEDESLIDTSLEDKLKSEVTSIAQNPPELTSKTADVVSSLKVEIKRDVEFQIGNETIIIEKKEAEPEIIRSEKESTILSETTSTGVSDASPIISPIKSTTERSSDPEQPIRRKIPDVDTSSSSSNKRSHRKSGLEVDTYSSSGESHYHSFEVDSGKSRPCSSDVEVLIAAGSSEYESALASQETSSKSHVTSAEYHTAVSSLSSKESMKSLDSESSGNLASVEVSEASETLVPSELEFNGEIQNEPTSKGDICIQRQTTNESELELDLRDSPDISEEDLLDEKNIQELSSKMKRSHEMNFPSENKSPLMEQVSIEDKLGTSLDDGSVLSVSLSSTSSLAQTRTVIENIHSDQQSFGSLASLEDVTGRSDLYETQQSPALSAINLCISTKTPDDDTVYDSVTLITSSVEHEGIQSVSTQVTSYVQSTVEDRKKSDPKLSEVVVEPKKKSHRRNESTSNFTPEKIIFGKERELISDVHEASVISKAQDSHLAGKQKTDDNNDIAIQLKKKFTPDIIDKHRLDKRDSHTKSSTTSSERSSFEEAEAEAAFSMVAHISPVHKMKQICPIIEDETAEKNELEAREQLERELEKNRALNKESAAFIPDIKVTQHMAPMERDGFHYPDLEIEEKDEESQNTTPQTPASISSKSSDSTDQGREYILEDSRMSIIDESEGSQSVDEKMVESKSEAATEIEKTICETDKETESPGSDSFELVEKPDIIDDFVVIEEVAKEAHEADSEGKSLKITTHKYIKKHDTEVEQYLVKSAPEPSNKMTNIQYYPQAQRTEELGFEFEESPPQADVKDTSAANYVQEFDKELEENKKWIEQQFLGDQASMAAAGYGYEMDFERGPLEDIKEEDATDFDSSRIGSLSSHKESGGSLGSVKDSYSSTPEYDVLAGRKYFTKSGENDDISMSSLQEFENMERAMSLENRKFHQGSHDSSSNGSFKNRYSGRSGAGDDVSVSSLKEFEGLEKACIAAHKVELKVKEEEAMLSQIDECQESIISETESCETFSGTDKKLIPDSDEDDYEKRMFEIDEIIRQAQTNVEHFIDFKEGERTESIGRGDSVEEVSKVPDLDLDLPLKREPAKTSRADDELMITSTDSLDVKVEKQPRYNSSDSLDAEQKTAADLMTDSTDSIEFHAKKSAYGTLSTDSMEAKLVESDSLDLAAAVVRTTQLSDSIDEDGSRIVYYDHSTSSTGKDYSLSGKEETADTIDLKGTTEFMLESCDSIASTSTATYAHQYEGESIYSGSCTSGDSNTMVSSTDTIDPIMSVSAEVTDASIGTKKIWFDEDMLGAGRMYTTEYYDEGGKSRVTETVEREPDGSVYSHSVRRTVEMPAQVVKMTFSGSDAQTQLERYMESMQPGESVEETEEVDADGNVHIKRVVKKTTIVKDTGELPEGQGVISRTLTDEHGSKTIYTQAFDLDSLDQIMQQRSISGMSSQGESSHAIRSEEVQQKDDQTKTSETRKVKDQQELSQEMKDILKALNEDSYK